jgi:hypothetical protein
MPALAPGPLPRPDSWLQHVKEPQTEAEVERLRLSVRRDRPYGETVWMKWTALGLGIDQVCPTWMAGAGKEEEPSLSGSGNDD